MARCFRAEDTGGEALQGGEDTGGEMLHAGREKGLFIGLWWSKLRFLVPKRSRTRIKFENYVPLALFRGRISDRKCRHVGVGSKGGENSVTLMGEPHCHLRGNRSGSVFWEYP